MASLPVDWKGSRHWHSLTHCWISMEEEVQTESWYVQRCVPNSTVTRNIGTMDYCNRAGKYESWGKGERSLKSQGSSEAISHYLAHIHASMDMATNMVAVLYSSTHYSHDTPLGHLRITSTTRKMIATKLQQDVTTQCILGVVQCSGRVTKLSRIMRLWKGGGSMER